MKAKTSRLVLMSWAEAQVSDGAADAMLSPTQRCWVFSARSADALNFALMQHQLSTNSLNATARGTWRQAAMVSGLISIVCSSLMR